MICDLLPYRIKQPWAGESSAQDGLDGMSELEMSFGDICWCLCFIDEGLGPTDGESQTGVTAEYQEVSTVI